MKMKKILSMCLIGVMAMGLLAGCGSSDDQQSSSDNSKTESTDTASSEDTSDSGSQGDGKTLVVYYSATGSTKAVAEEIAKRTGGDIFEIEPKETYTDQDLDWTDDDSRVSREHDNEDERDVELVSTTVDNWDSYGTVFVGYPIWWGIAAWPVDNFIKDNDFTGKTVIPFCTSSSSGIGDSGKLLEKMAGTGNWQDGQRFRSGADNSDIDAWVDSLGLTE